MPAIERAFRDLGDRVGFVGVDVSDSRAAAAAFARRVGVTNPLVSDSSGDVASTYQIPGLPFTAIVGPRGNLQTLHPGALTTEQLEYVVKNLDPALMHG
jgi:peroxiredoxin